MDAITFLYRRTLSYGSDQVFLRFHANFDAPHPYSSFHFQAAARNNASVCLDGRCPRRGE